MDDNFLAIINGQPISLTNTKVNGGLGRCQNLLQARECAKRLMHWSIIKRIDVFKNGAFKGSISMGKPKSRREPSFTYTGFL